jgi:hypothetical protein
MLQANPTLTPAEVRSKLFSNTCTKTTTPSCPTGTVPNKSYGHGRIDALAAYDAVSAPPPILDNAFSTGTNGWLKFGGTDYTLTNDAGTAKISGNGYMVKAGMEKTVSLENWDASKPLRLSFDWRAKSDYAGSTVTNAYLKIDGDVSPLVAGGTLDTGWKTYSKDITTLATGKSSIKIRLYLVDSWSANWNQVNWYDNIKLNGAS